MPVCHLDVRLCVIVLRESHRKGTDVTTRLRVTTIEQQHPAAGCVAMHLERMTPDSRDELGKAAVTSDDGAVQRLENQ